MPAENPILVSVTDATNMAKVVPLVRAVRRGGGDPIVVDPSMGPVEVTRKSRRSNGIVLGGGLDIHPKYYNAALHPKTKLADSVLYAARDGAELEEVLPNSGERPARFICRGMQIYEVYNGGRLIQHVPDISGEDIRHVGPKPEISTFAWVTVTPGSKPHEIFGVTSYRAVHRHHQAVDISSGSYLQIVGFSADGVPEEAIDPHNPYRWATQDHHEDSDFLAPGYFGSFGQETRRRSFAFSSSYF